MLIRSLIRNFEAVLAKMDKTIPYSINAGGRLIELSQPLVMGILNVTPDSFYAKSRKATEQEIEQRVVQIIQEGGDIIDIGAYSTRPGHSDVPEEEETARLTKALDIVRRTAPEAVLSVDTFRASVAERMVDEYGVAIVNDVTGGSDERMFNTVARLGVAYVLTNIESQALPVSLARSLAELREMGQRDIIIDPGFGFGKTLEDNYRVLMQLEAYRELQLPILVGVSRKRMVYEPLEITAEEALTGTTALHALALERGANILRVHDVKPAVEVIKILKQCSLHSA